MSLKQPRPLPDYDSLFDSNEYLDQQSEAIQDIWFAVARSPESVKTEFVRVAGHLGLLKARPSAEAPSITTANDGPGPQLTFRWKGEMCSFDRAPLRYRLLVALWDSQNARPHEERDFEDVMTDVYGFENGAEGLGKNASERMYDASDGSMRDLCSKTGQALISAGIEMTIRIRAGKIWLKPI